MLILAALLAASAPPPPLPEARATTRVLVRIVRGAGVRNGQVVSGVTDARPTKGRAQIVEPESGARTLSLIEFP